MQVIALKDLTHTSRQLKPKLKPQNHAKVEIAFITRRFLPWLIEPRPGLKVIIPKDASKPDGDAVENGALLSASELYARGHFVN
jgi:hypothetical protein